MWYCNYFVFQVDHLDDNLLALKKQEILKLVLVLPIWNIYRSISCLRSTADVQRVKRYVRIDFMHCVVFHTVDGYSDSLC